MQSVGNTVEKGGGEVSPNISGKSQGKKMSVHDFCTIKKMRHIVVVSYYYKITIINGLSVLLWKYALSFCTKTFHSFLSKEGFENFLD
jgi:hypothetical protein